MRNNKHAQQGGETLFKSVVYCTRGVSAGSSSATIARRPVSTLGMREKKLALLWFLRFFPIESGLLETENSRKREYCTFAVQCEVHRNVTQQRQEPCVADTAFTRILQKQLGSDSDRTRMKKLEYAPSKQSKMGRFPLPRFEVSIFSFAWIYFPSC